MAEETKTGYALIVSPYKCPKCGHIIPPNGKVQRDKDVRRLMPGNSLCPQCQSPIPVDCA